MGGWMPGATIRPGRNAGYQAGRSSGRSCVCHYTVGRDSAGVGDQGYFNFLVRRSGEVVQFAPSDAVTWHAGNWNAWGPGIEIEFLESYDGPAPANIFTPEQLAAAGRVCHFVSEAEGIPLDFYDGARIGSWEGFITHRSLIQSGDWHYNYWTREQFASAIGGAAAPPRPKGAAQGMFVRHSADGAIILLSPGRAEHVGDPERVARLRFVGVPYAGDMIGAQIQQWARDWGVPAGTWPL